MAQARTQGPGGFTPVHVWMIGFLFLWLTSLVLLVWLYTEQEDIKTKSEQLQRENQRLARSGDKSLPWYSQASESGPSMASLLEEARKQTVLIAIGEEADDVESVRTKVVEFFSRIREDDLVDDVAAFDAAELLPAMTVLYENFKGQRALRTRAQGRADAAEQQLGEWVETHERIQSEFRSTSDKLKNQIAAIKQEQDDYYARRDEEVDQLGRKMEDMRQTHSRELQSKANEIRDGKQQYTDLQTRYAELQTKLGELQIKPGEQLTARREDGRIVMALPGDDVIYINLGRMHQLTVGLQFAVYPASGIPVDGRSKARIEVTRIFDSTAECRILALDRSEVVIDGDLVANPVYDPTRALRFVVVGNFDLDGNGQEDPRGADQIKSLITDWGGEVVEQLSSRIDFVVAGSAPVIPKTAASLKSTRDRDIQERDRLLQRRRDEYEHTIASASNLSIPILTQEVFLQFLGF